VVESENTHHSGRRKTQHHGSPEKRGEGVDKSVECFKEVKEGKV
jgi:hypothetical protein